MTWPGNVPSFTTAPSNLEDDKALGLMITALINTYFHQNEVHAQALPL